MRYERATRDDLAVCIAWFSPCDFRLPREHLARVLHMLAATGVHVTLAQIVRTGQQPVTVPDGVQDVRLYCDSVLFHKESLLNIAVRATPHPKVLCIDGDIIHDDPEWLDKASQTLDSCDVMQPFDCCAWLDRDGTPYLARASCAAAFLNGSSFDGKVHHPGFAWGLRRSFFDAAGGLYDLHPVGGGDTAFGFAVDPSAPRDALLSSWARVKNLFAETHSFRAYKARVTELRPRIGCMTGTVLHPWHGDRKSRQYITRNQLLPELVDGEYPLRRRGDGLLEWLDPSMDERLLTYFRSREEDG